MGLRSDPIIDMGQRPPVGPVRRILDVLSALFGKTTGYVDIALLLEMAGYVTAASSATPGTREAKATTVIDFADGIIDSVRLVIRGKNSVAGSVDVFVYDETNSRDICSVRLTGITEATYIGAWTTLPFVKPATATQGYQVGSDQEIDLRIRTVGTADTPTLYAVHLQCRTTSAQA